MPRMLHRTMSLMMPQEMEDEIAQDRKSLARLFARIDLDGSGQLTLDELIEGRR